MKSSGARNSGSEKWVGAKSARDLNLSDARPASRRTTWKENAGITGGWGESFSGGPEGGLDLDLLTRPAGAGFGGGAVE